MKDVQFVSLLISLYLASIQTVRAEVNNKFTLETGLEYYSGKYGTNQATDILYVPVTGKVQGKDWTLKLTIPYLEITGANTVVDRLGQTVAVASNNRSVRSGMGDWIVAATRNVYNGGSGGFAVNLTGRAKFATADSAKGLGTGANDYALETTVFKPYESLTTFGTLGYKNYGSPATYKLNDVFYGSLGGSYKFDQYTNGGAMLIASQRVMASRSNRAEVLLFVSHSLAKQWKTQGYVLKGFTNSVPDVGGGVLVDYVFLK
jgi:hypothetical protein